MMSKQLPSIRLWPWLSEAAVLEMKVVGRLDRASRWSQGEGAAMRGQRQSSRGCNFAFIPVALSGHILEFAWGVPVESANLWR